MIVTCRRCSGSGDDPYTSGPCIECAGNGERETKGNEEETRYGVLDIYDKVIAMETTLDNLDTKLDTLDTHLDTIETKIDALLPP